MPEETITTGVDALLELLKSTDKISIPDAAQKLRVPLDTLQAWVDFLVEERIIGLEYKFTKPFIYLNKEEPKKKEKRLQIPQLKEIKKEYMDRAHEKKIPADQILRLWEAHVRQELAYLEPYFNEQAQRRGLQDTHERRRLWDGYNTQLLHKLQQLV